jgi:hypothetical protein
MCQFKLHEYPAMGNYINNKKYRSMTGKRLDYLLVGGRWEYRGKKYGGSGGSGGFGGFGGSP